MSIYDDLEKCVGFDWDDRNEGKNWEKHRVSDGETEEIFFNRCPPWRAKRRRVIPGRRRSF